MKKLTRRGFTAAGILAVMSVAGASLKRCNPFEPSDNEIEAVYGPPEVLGWGGPDDDGGQGDDNDPETEPDPADNFDPANNELVDVYGPPEYFGEVDEEEDYDPTDNMVEGVYGPPNAG